MHNFLRLGSALAMMLVIVLFRFMELLSEIRSHSPGSITEPARENPIYERSTLSTALRKSPARTYSRFQHITDRQLRYFASRYQPAALSHSRVFSMTKSISSCASSGNIGNEMQQAAFRSEFGNGPAMRASLPHG
jgi:hypothetical protein